MVPEIRNELLSILAYLQKKRSVVASQDDLLQVIRVVQYLLTGEAISMALHDNVPYQRGFETGSIIARSFVLTDDSKAHFALAKLFLRLYSYNDGDSVLEFMAGFQAGIEDNNPKMLSDGKGE